MENIFQLSLKRLRTIHIAKWRILDYLILMVNIILKIKYTSNILFIIGTEAYSSI